MSKFFIRRPIVAIVIAILMTLVGAVSMIQLPIAQYPNIVPPEIQVRANYTGADAQTIEQSVAAPIEQQMSGVDKSNYIQSVNANGSIRMTINFDIATDPNVDHILAQMRVNQASSQLPQDVVNAGLTVQKSTTAPLLLIALNSPKGTYNNVFLANYARIFQDDVFMTETDEGDPVDRAEDVLHLDQPRGLFPWQVDLGYVARDDDL